MAEQVYTNCKFYAGGYDFSGKMNALGLDYSAEIQDKTTFGNTSRVKLAGLRDTAFSHQGFFNASATAADDIDGAMFGNIGLDNVLMTICPTDGAENEKAFFMQTEAAGYSPGASIGDIFAFSVEGGGSGELVRGTILVNAAKSSTGNGTARQVGAVSETQKMHAGLHVYAASGSTPTLDVEIESDDNSGMSSAITRGTFTQATGITSQWLTPVSGEITDDWWRVTWALGGGSPNFTFIVSLGIK